MSRIRTVSLVVLTLVAFLVSACGGGDDGGPSSTERSEDSVESVPPVTYVGRDRCAECHAEESRRHRGSHHDLAMQEASDSTVLGDFDGASFSTGGVTSTFSRRDGKFVVRTDGPDGQLHDYEIAYTFGVTPLQQYLVAFPGGRYQALGIAWDSRPREQGGQRWFHLYPDRPPRPGDPLHWTGIDQTWNHMCAECHSTDLRKGYRRGRRQLPDHLVGDRRLAARRVTARARRT